MNSTSPTNAPPPVAFRSGALAATTALVALFGVTQAPSPLVAGTDLASSLTLRVGDARGVPGGQVTIQLKTYQSRPVKQGRITVGGKPTGAPSGTRAATLPFSSCSAPIVFSAGLDALVTGQSFDALNQVFEFDFESATASINATDGPLAAFVCTLDASLADGDTFDLDVSIAPGDSSFDDPGLDTILLAPRAGRLRVRDALNPSVSVEDSEVKPGAMALIELATDYAFAIESGQIEVEIDPTLVRASPSVRALPRHGTVALGTQSWDAGTGRFTFAFESSDDTLNSVVPGTLFEVSIPTVANPDLVDLDFPVTLIGGSSFLVGPDATALGAGFEAGTLLFSLNPKVEDVFRDGFGGGTAYPWTSQVGWVQ